MLHIVKSVDTYKICLISYYTTCLWHLIKAIIKMAMGLDLFPTTGKIIIPQTFCLKESLDKKYKTLILLTWLNLNELKAYLQHCQVHFLAFICISLSSFFTE
jgi:hypothetical protein